jgi:hypothetical protein
VKYRRSLFTEEIEQVIVEVMGGFIARYEIEEDIKNQGRQEEAKQLRLFEL